MKRRALVEQLGQIQNCINSIDWKQSLYDDMLYGKNKQSEKQYKSKKIDMFFQ